MIKGFLIGVLCAGIGSMTGLAIIETYGPFGWALVIPACLTIGIGVSELVDMIA